MNTEQQQAFDAVVKERQNVFISGSGGVGKSYVIQEIAKSLSANQIPFAVTATTGVASLLIRGRTIHSFLGIGLAKEPANLLVRKATIKRPLIKKLTALQVLIIDEVSMMSAELFEKINEYLCLIRKDTAPFGGVQIVLCGDFAQLKSVEGDFCFTSELWPLVIDRTIELTKIMRQTDTTLHTMLNDLRLGRITSETIAVLKSRVNHPLDHLAETGIEPTVLYSHNCDVDRINQKELSKLKSKLEKGENVYLYSSHVEPESAKETVLKSLKIPEAVELCKGAQVMITYNIDSTLGIMNGSRGVVVGFTKVRQEDGSEQVLPLVRFVNGKVYPISYNTYDDEERKVVVTYLPIKCSWAITIHKSQSMSIDYVKMSLGSRIFECGQAYTALSRIRDLNNVSLIDFDPSAFRANPKVVAFYNQKSN
jgi:ATP-dependent DNA helicase PIF1